MNENNSKGIRASKNENNSLNEKLSKIDKIITILLGIVIIISTFGLLITTIMITNLKM